MQGFTPVSQQQWKLYNWIDGCVRNVSLNCVSDKFVPIKGLKLPDMTNFLVNNGISLMECDLQCRRNCSCTAYANSDFREGGSGCILRFDDLFDFRHLSDAGDQHLCLCLASSEGELMNKGMKNKSPMLMKILLSVGSVVLFFCLVISMSIWKISRTGRLLKADERRNEDLELPLLDLITLETATNNFSHTNKIGEGGFGPVYKGKTSQGQKIVVKR